MISIVAVVNRLEPPGDAIGFVEDGRDGFPPGTWLRKVTFDNGAHAYLNLSDPYSAVLGTMLERLRRIHSPAYVSICGNRVITDTLIPRQARVLDISAEAPGVFDVQLDGFPARHLATADRPEMIERLHEARRDGRVMMISADPESRVIRDVRLPETVLPEGDPLPADDSEEGIIAHTSVVSIASAAKFFASLRARACSLPEVNGECLPFQYPDDFCFAVANHVCNLLRDRGVVAGKAWVHGRLRFRTPNRERCFQECNFHVAAFVRTTDSVDPRHLLILDPTIFLEQGPVLLPLWRQALRGIDASDDLVITDARRYRQLRRGDGVGELPGETALHLEKMRIELRKRAGGRSSPPPYSHCEA